MAALQGPNVIGGYPHPETGKAVTRAEHMKLIEDMEQVRHCKLVMPSMYFYSNPCCCRSPRRRYTRACGTAKTRSAEVSA